MDGKVDAIKDIKRNSLWVWLVLIIGAGLLLTACGSSEAAAKPKPSQVSADGRITLTSRAVERLGLQTGAVNEAMVGGQTRAVVPYGAVMYGLNGETWVYTNPDTMVYLRHPIILERIDGDMGIMVEGPPPGTPVVTVGAAELFGAETGIGK